DRAGGSEWLRRALRVALTPVQVEFGRRFHLVERYRMVYYGFKSPGLKPGRVQSSNVQGSKSKGLRPNPSSGRLRNIERLNQGQGGPAMPPHSIGSGTISFGLVSIPVKLYPAASSQAVAFNMLHAKCGNRIRQQRFCPVCNEVVERDGLMRGYEFAKDQYVTVNDDELKALEGEASKAIEISEFVPLSKVDPIYFEKSYYLGPDKGGEKAYRLLADAMTQAD